MVIRPGPVRSTVQWVVLEKVFYRWHTSRTLHSDVLTPRGITRPVYRSYNLNQEISILGYSLLWPNTAEMNNTNAAGSQLGMLGATIGNCTAKLPNITQY